MEGRTLAIGAFNTKLDDNFEIVAETEEEREKIRKGMEEVEARITDDMDPVKAARQMDVDEVVRVGEIRSYLEVLVEASLPGLWLSPRQEPEDLVASRHRHSRGGRTVNIFPAVEVLVRSGDVDGELVLESPAPGWWAAAPRVGEVVVAGSRAGRLTSLGRTVELVVPHGVTGRVVERRLITHSDPVGYGTVLLRLMPVAASDGEVRGGVHPGEAVSDLPDGAFAVVSPTHGMFYRRPRPDEPSYVEVGQIVESGSTLGLVEVMKCFSAITYGGQQLPARAEVVEIRADDGAEVKTDQILFVVKPA